MYSCIGKAEFSASLLQSVSHDPSEIILICWFETFLLIIKTVVLHA